jgi:hypothetical protein
MGENPTDVTMGNQQETDIAWLAGVFDGEGTLSLGKNNGTKHPDWNARKITLVVPNSDERLILRAVEIFERMGITPYITCGEPNAHQNLDRWRVCVTQREDVRKVVIALIPYLTAKREQAILMRRYVESRLKREFILNQKQPDGKRHKLTRRPISEAETKLADRLLTYNDPLSGPSQTIRKAARETLIDIRRANGRMI